MQKYADNREM